MYPILITAIQLFCFFFLTPTLILSQNKYEKETRVKKTEVPPIAVRWVKTLLPDTKIKWYRETSLIDLSYEAKGKHQHEHYSIEFDTSGQLQDVEIRISSSDIPDVASQKIQQKLREDFRKYKLIKIQKQLTGPNEKVLQYLRSGNTPIDITTRFEIVVAGKNKKNYQVFEYTFSINGAFENRTVIVYRNTDNLEY